MDATEEKQIPLETGEDMSLVKQRSIFNESKTETETESKEETNNEELTAKVNWMIEFVIY